MQGEISILPSPIYLPQFLSNIKGLGYREEGIAKINSPQPLIQDIDGFPMDLELIDLKEFREWGVDYLMDVIRKDLDDFRVKFDVWTSQSKVAHEKAVLAGV